MVGVYSNDIPPIPISVTDTINVQISIDNNVGAQASKMSIGEMSLLGSELYSVIENLPVNQNTAEVIKENGEWYFGLQDKFWTIKGFTMYVPLNQMRKYVKEL